MCSIREFCELETPIFMFDKDGSFIVMTLEQVCFLDCGMSRFMLMMHIVTSSIFWSWGSGPCGVRSPHKVDDLVKYGNGLMHVWCTLWFLGEIDHVMLESKSDQHWVVYLDPSMQRIRILLSSVPVVQRGICNSLAPRLRILLYIDQSLCTYFNVLRPAPKNFPNLQSQFHYREYRR